LPDQLKIVTAHFERLLSLTRHLGDMGVDIHGHEYDPHFSETWKIIAGSYRHRFQFRWDGNVHVLTVSEAFFDILGSWESNWKELRKVDIDVSNGGDPFKYVNDFFSN
jgi:hypothetical protein